MLVPVVVADSTSPSPAKVPPLIWTVAEASVVSSASLTVALGASTDGELGMLAFAGIPLGAGGWLKLTTMLCGPVEAGALSVTVNVSVRDAVGEFALST